MFKITSEFIQTPCRKLSRFAFDLTKGKEISVNFDDVAGSYARVDITTWQDEASTINKESLVENLKRWGALDVDIRIIRVPRQTVRSEAVLKVESLREKLVAMAALKEETVSESILQKADELEAGPVDEVIRRAA